MHRIAFRLLPALAFASTPLFAQNSITTVAPDASVTPISALAKPKEPLVEFEMMTWPEVKEALAAGKTTALFYTGGTEQRGPQNVNGGHTLMGKATVKAIALKLGNAIAMPVLPYTPNNASAALPRHHRPHPRDPRCHPRARERPGDHHGLQEHHPHG